MILSLRARQPPIGDNPHFWKVRGVAPARMLASRSMSSAYSTLPLALLAARATYSGLASSRHVWGRPLRMRAVQHPGARRERRPGEEALAHSPFTKRCAVTA